jgi:hypothetical protein
VNNQSKFNNLFKKLLDENNFAGPGGAFGGDLQGGEGQGGAIKCTDWFAPGDTRSPTIIGKKKIKEKKVPIIRRPKIAM